MTIKYDSFLPFAELVAEALTGAEPMRPKDIAKRIREMGRGHPPQSAVNKVLTQYLIGRVQRCENGRWRLTATTT